MKSKSSVNWNFVLLGYAALLAYGMVDNMRGPFYPDLILDLGLNQEKGSFFFVVASFAAFIASAWIGRYSTEFSFVWGLRIGLLTISLGVFLISATDRWELVLCGSSLVGVGFGVVSVYQNLAVQAGSSPDSRRRLFSGLHSMYALSSLAAPLIASLVVSVGGDWRAGFRWVGLAPLGVLLASFMVGSNRTEVVSPQKSEEVQRRYSRLHSYWLAWILGAYVSAEILISTRLPLVLRTMEGVSASEGAIGLAAFFAFLLFGRGVFTLYRFRALTNKQILVSSLLCTLVFLILGIKHSPWWLTASGLSMAPFFAVAVDYHVEAFGAAAARPLATSVAFCSLLVVIMHYGMGWISQHFGMKAALCVAPSAIALSLILLLTEGWLIRGRQVMN